MQRKAFGQLEENILKAIEKLHRATIREIHELLGGDNAYTTIMTVLDRMYKKGFVSREKEGRNYVYFSPIAPNKDNSFSRRLKRIFFQNSTFEAVHYFLDHAEGLSNEEIALLEKKIQEVKNVE